MRNIRKLLLGIAAMGTGAFMYSCTNDRDAVDGPGGAKSDKCDLLSFSIEGERNSLRSTIVFDIDQQNLTATATYLAAEEETMPAEMIPTFSIDGERARANGYGVESGLASISFAEEVVFVVIAENGDTKTYTISLEWRGGDDPDDPDPGPNPDGSDECDLISFGLSSGVNNLPSSVTFTIDQSNLTVKGRYLTWITNEEPEMMIPTFTTTGEKLLVDNKEIVSRETKISFADDFVLTVVAENGNMKEYTVSLNCPQINTELPVLHIHIPVSSVTSQSTYLYTDIDLYSPHTASGRWDSTDGQVRIRGRGNSTWGLPKKPYRIKFPEDFSPVGLDHAKEKDWVILAHDMDKSLLRNHAAFELSRVLFDPAEGYHDQSAIMFTPCSQHINVYSNGTYHGVYQMTDQMERGDGRIAVDKLTASYGDDPYQITGGHILETDIHGESAPVRFNSSRGIQINHKYPKSDDYHTAQYTYIENFIREAEAALYGSNFKDPDSGWRKYFDEKTLADFIIVKEFAGDMDGYTSTYMYKRRGVDKIFFGPIWDCDKAWDNDKRVPHGSYPPTSSLMMYAGFYMPPYINPDWFHRLWQDETFRAFVAARWAAKKAELVAAVFKVLDEKPAAMAKAVEANFAVWPFYYQYSDEAKMPAATYELEIERMRNLTSSRSALLDQLLR